MKAFLILVLVTSSTTLEYEKIPIKNLPIAMTHLKTKQLGLIIQNINQAIMKFGVFIFTTIKS